MTTTTPKVSIGLPVYNGEKYLRQAMDRLLAQEYTDFELIISDNASTDSTPEICREYAQKDSRIRYSRNEENIGIAANHNRVFELARGKYFKWVAHDDDYPKQMLGRLVAALDAAAPSVVVVYSLCECINEAGELIEVYSDRVGLSDPSPHRRLDDLLTNITLYNCTYGLIRSEVLRKTRLHGLFPATDRVLFAELAMLGELLEIQEPLLRIRIHSGRTFQAAIPTSALRKMFNPRLKDGRSWLSIDGRVQLELIRSAWIIPDTLLERWLCCYVAIVSPNWRKFKKFVGQQRIKLLHLLKGTPSTSEDFSHSPGTSGRHNTTP